MAETELYRVSVIMYQDPFLSH